MPSALLRQCPGDGGRCPELVAHGRCAAHARQHDQRRGTAHERGYTSQWASFAKRWLARFPFCGMRRDGQLHTEHSVCVQQGLVTQAQCVHHMDGHSRPDDKATFRHEARLESLCLACNTAWANAHEGGFGR